jgi:hypothetical protein
MPKEDFIRFIVLVSSLCTTKNYSLVSRRGRGRDVGGNLGLQIFRATEMERNEDGEGGTRGRREEERVGGRGGSPHFILKRERRTRGRGGGIARE